jgi:hypothetical protein
MIDFLIANSLHAIDEEEYRTVSWKNTPDFHTLQAVLNPRGELNLKYFNNITKCLLPLDSDVDLHGAIKDCGDSNVIKIVIFEEMDSNEKLDSQESKVLEEHVDANSFIAPEIDTDGYEFVEREDGMENSIFVADPDEVVRILIESHMLETSAASNKVNIVESHMLEASAASNKVNTEVDSINFSSKNAKEVASEEKIDERKNETTIEKVITYEPVKQTTNEDTVNTTEVGISPLDAFTELLHENKIIQAFSLVPEVLKLKPVVKFVTKWTHDAYNGDTEKFLYNARKSGELDSVIASTEEKVASFSDFGKVIQAFTREKLKDIDEVVHDRVTCDNCGSFPIIGCRYKCFLCENFDLCSKCYEISLEESTAHNMLHPFVVIRNKQQSQLVASHIGYASHDLAAGGTEEGEHPEDLNKDHRTWHHPIHNKNISRDSGRGTYQIPHSHGHHSGHSLHCGGITCCFYLFLPYFYYCTLLFNRTPFKSVASPGVHTKKP